MTNRLLPWQRASSDEIAAVEAVLAATGDPRVGRLTLQIATCPVKRRRRGRRLVVEPRWITDDLAVDVDDDWTSGWLVAATTAGSQLRVRLTVWAGGFLGPLEMEGEKPLARRFGMDVEALGRSAQGVPPLGGPGELPGLRRWVADWIGELPEGCGVTAQLGGAVARSVLLAKGRPCPRDLLALVGHYDGLRVGNRRLLPAVEMWVVTLDGVPYWIIDEAADQWTALHGHSGEVHRIDKGDDRSVLVQPTLQRWLLQGCQ